MRESGSALRSQYLVCIEESVMRVSRVEADFTRYDANVGLVNQSKNGQLSAHVGIYFSVLNCCPHATLLELLPTHLVFQNMNQT
jgi:hypothetical protein